MQAFEIIRLAEKASFVWEELSPVERMMIYQFADLVAAAEREACADIADQHASIEGIAQNIADAIRARGNK